MEEIIVGIDLGTTNTLACYLRKGKPTLIKFPGSGKLLPSIIYIDENKDIVVGKRAREKGKLDPNNEICSAKRYMGDFSKKWNCRGCILNSTDVATNILKEVKKSIIKKFKCDENTIINAVITVPAYFNSNQTDETKKAGINAGFNVLRIITEPMSAAIAAVKELELNEKILIIDIGGGTFDLSVLEADQVSHSYRALAIDGDRRLGGDDFDKKLTDYFIKIIEDDLGIDLSTPKNSGLDYNEYFSMLKRIKDAAENAKIELSSEVECDINIFNLFEYNSKLYNFNINLTRDEFNNICHDLYDKIINRIKSFIQKEEGFFLKDIKKVILVGGTCYIPYIQEEVEKIFNISVSTEMDRSTMVVVGACFVAESEKGGVAINVQDVLSHSLGIEVFDMKNQKMLLSKLLCKGDVYPTYKTKTFTTTMDNQTEININVYEAGSDCEGEEEIKYHDFYGGFVLDGIEIAPKGKPNIDVTFSYDKSRCLTVVAEDKKTKAKKEIKIKKGEKIYHNKRQNPIDFMLLLDTSTSMCGSALLEAKKACNALLEEMIDFNVHQMGLVIFASTAQKLSGLSKDEKRLKSYINNILAMGSTNMVSALQLAYSELSNSENKRVIIMVTDGVPDSISETLNYVKRLKLSNIRIIAIGVGNDINTNFLEQLANKNDAYKLNNMSELRDTFKEVIMKVTEK